MTGHHNPDNHFLQSLHLMPMPKAHNVLAGFDILREQQSAPTIIILSLAVAVVVAAFSMSDSVRQSLLPQAEYFSTLNLPAEIIKFGHPGNMAVVSAVLCVHTCSEIMAVVNCLHLVYKQNT